MKVNHKHSAFHKAKPERDLLALGIALAAAILFVGTGGSIMPKIMRAWMGGGDAPDLLLTNAVLLNIALLIFGWRRYKDLHREITERRRAEALAQTLAETDPLTGCLNRRSGMPAIEKLNTAARAQQKELVLFMLDLDNFKSINDIHGHHIGDCVLVAVTSRVRNLMPQDGLLIRIGGDEFLCAIASDPQSFSQIEALASRIVTAVSEPHAENGILVEATISVGIATSAAEPGETEALTCEALAHRADIAMYHAKKQGRNSYVWFNPQMESELRFRSEIESGIRQGIPAGEFVPYFEQQIDLETGELVGFEMLARWYSPRLGVIKPEIFIPIAEETGLIAALSESLIRKALHEANHWHPKLTLSVNISPVQMRDPWFAQKLLQMLVESGFPPQRLEVEITESCLHENIGAVRAIVASLKNQGIQLSLDDFGTGYSSLAQLRSLPFDRLKIDRSFISEIGDSGSKAGLVKAMISLGQSLSLPVTAEGVENTEVLAALKGLGQLKGQGYLYGQPESSIATRARLAAMNMLKAGPQTPFKEAMQILPETRVKPAETRPARRKSG